uniref:Uncharacterized protein n=1 Tax=Ciona intestinalis TaxID=7719 RepID=H2XY13_CIOIN
MDEIPTNFVDNVTHYTLYANKLSDCNKLEEILLKCQAIVAKETHGHIWQNEPFQLSICKTTTPFSLKGNTNYGDSVDDEWFIVYLLHKITISLTQLVATINDSDGEFLLIEAAEYLPKWLTPTTCNNRVFISKGLVHIVLKPASPSEIDILPIGDPTLQQALDAVSNYPWLTQASSSIISCIQKRISGFPCQDNVFHANVYLCESIVHLLDKNPSLISPAVQAFYLRNPVDLRACRNFTYFKPENRVWSQIPMTRCHYAQLMQQQFIADKRSGYLPSSALPPKQNKGVDLGMKISHGLEILCSKVKPTKSAENSAETALFDEDKFNSFVSYLKETGYFRNELEGSKLYNQLKIEAQKFFTENCVSDRNVPTEQDVLVNMVKMLKIWGKSGFPKLETLVIKDILEELPNESSDKWMYLDENAVEELTKEMNLGFKNLHIGKKKKKTADLSQETIKETVEKMKTFVGEVSGLEGVETTNDISPVVFDVENFMLNVENMLGHAENMSDESSSEFLTSDEETDTDLEEEKNEIQEYMEKMDSELSATAVGKSFVKLKSENAGVSENISTEEQKLNEDNAPVNIDLNLVENFLQGCHSQAGLAGPVTNVLGSLGINIPSGVDLN